MGNSGSSTTPPSNCHPTHSVPISSNQDGLLCGSSLLEDTVCKGGLPSPLLHSHKTSGEASGKKRRGNLSSLATLRKRFVRKGRRSSKCLDHAQVIRDFLSGWSTRDLLSLVEEYEGARLLKELHLQAEIARPSASTVASDLTELYDFKYAADTVLLFKGVSFSVHKAIICVRCPLFRELLGKVNTFGAQVPVNIDIPGLRPDFFNDLLRYLYSGELTPFSSPASNTSSSYDPILLRLTEQFGVPNALDQDLKHLLNTGLYSDASLVFSPPPPAHDYNSSQTVPANVLIKKCRACSDQAEYSCHSAILASRSPFFKNVIQRHQRRFTEAQALDHGCPSGTVNTANQKIRIVLDETIISRRFARIILHSMYRDSIDLMSLLPGCVCKCSIINSETGGSASTNGSVGTASSSHSSGASSSAHHGSSILPSSYVKEVMDLYEIARFLELDTLIVCCEDIIVDALTVENLVSILKWSEQAHGSPWVKRQALCFLREEFSAIASTSVLYQLEVSHLLESIKSDFLQASELEILQAVIKWGENRLLKRMEEREPNVVSQTTHSLRRGLRKRELNDGELRDIISDLMPHIRFGHILPLDTESLTSALKRGLISTLPPFMLGEDSGLPYVRGVSSWLRSKCNSGNFLRPRVFNPYMEEAKACLEERLGRPGEMIPTRCTRGISQIPDALYMVEKTCPNATHDFYATQSFYEQYPEIRNVTPSSQLPVIEQRVLVLMKQREEELKTLALSHRALALISSRQELTKLIQLRVAREFGLPDAAVDVLSGEHTYVPYPPTETTSEDLTTSYGVSGMVPSSGVLSNLGSNGASGDSDKDPYSLGGDLCMENRTTSDCYLSGYSYEPEYFRSGHRLSEVIPDIAMATSALVDLHLFKRSTDSLIRQQPAGPGPSPAPRAGTSLDFERISFLQ